MCSEVQMFEIHFFFCSMVHFRAQKRSLGDDLKTSQGKIIKMGNTELTHLWNLSADNMSACRDPKRYCYRRPNL